MKLAYVSLFDATDVRNWSGLDLHIWKSLAAQGVDINLMGNLIHQRSLHRRLRKLVATHIERKVFSPLWEIDTARGYAQDAATRIAKAGVEAILSPSPIPLAYLERDEPIFLWTDSTFSGLLNFYPEYSEDYLSSASIRSGLAIDRASLDRCTLAIYSSEWAAQIAMRNYNIAPDKVKVVPFGANLEQKKSSIEIKEVISRRSRKCLRLLFIGVDWKRKGGPMALAAAQEVHHKGIEVELTVVGCQPETHEPLPAFVKCLGFISKSTLEGKTILERLFEECHVIILPTIAECCPVVLTEAHAYGVICAATNVGGIPTIVQDNVTGRLFDLEDPAEKWAEWLCAIFDNNHNYSEMAMSAFERYQTTLNWNKTGKSVTELMLQHLK